MPKRKYESGIFKQHYQDFSNFNQIRQFSVSNNVNIITRDI